jgi:xanthine dehydrogenase accessory factor
VSNFYRQLAVELARQPVVLATVTQIYGSTPREVGAKMFICEDGRAVGTIGGGAGEAKVCNQASQILKTNTKQFVDINLSGEPGREMEGACGGQMRVWLERWDKSLLPLVEQIVLALESGEPATIATPFDQAPYLVPELIETPQLTATGCFVEPIEIPPVLLIIGAGHIAVQLARVAHLAGFQIIVADDRAELTTVERFPNAVLLTTSIHHAIQTVSCARSRYIALVTRSVEQDVIALKALLTYSMNYIGMIGSRNRIQLVSQTLANQGDNINFLKTIHAPIGLEIGALTPEEIAISICAELIQVRRGGTAHRLSEMESLFS